ncbi:MAG: hypothetical protein OXL34_09280 [Gemmatimonadota bacterium]|nr:hypothetical protein [Gemmatimonadota bacterium]
MRVRTASLARTVGRRIVKPWCGAAGVFLFLTASSASGQQPGDTVRISGEQVGVVVDADSAGLLLSSAYAPYAGMRSLEVWGGTRNHAGRGFKLGFAAGAIPVGVLSAIFCESGRPVGEVCTASDWATLMAWSGAVGLLGGLVGLLIGGAIETDIWSPVPIPGGLSLRLAVGGRSPF